jgi:hypothetical protein
VALLIFWITIVLLGYAFFGYPLCLRLLAAFGRPAHGDAQYTPLTSLILSVYNEEAVIRKKIENFLALEYPADLLELLIISDGCEDRTEEIVSSYTSDRIRLFIQSQRGGKTLALNRGAAEARGEILLFTDANTLFDADAVHNLVRHFADPEVGLVSGASLYYDEQTGITLPTSAYRRYEDLLKAWESLVGGIVGADGAIYALRKNLYEPLIPEHINDLIHPIQVVIRGFRALQDNEAFCREPVDTVECGEMRRQTRIMAQSWRILCSQIGGLLVCGRFLYLWQLLSHKFLRWLTLPLMALLFITTVSLLGHGLWFQICFVGQSLFFALGLVGFRSNGRIPQIVFLFLLLHLAAVTGFIRYLRGTTYVTWSPRDN